ncbi:hypothetical protein L3Q82_009996 [Scortum barcoo]|uniref:Uncharacterized protein n=1 Tax=Scortum barcoo TaxID=214431 RepID=A0ACB8WEM5_9TELE|nr:hypothetical protein L3Q82_009996 [Scortum barcoo]
MLGGDLVAVWEVALSDGVYRIEFAHGTTTGKRVVYINGQVDGKSLQKFTHDRAQTSKTWLLKVDGEDCRVVLEKDTMDVWCNGQKMDTMGEFVDDGTETYFMVGEHECCIKATSSGKKKSGIVHYLLLDGEKIPASTQ